MAVKRRYLAVHELPADEARAREALRRVAEAAHAEGLHVSETFHVLSDGHAYTLFEAPGEAAVRETLLRAGLAPSSVVPAAQLYPDLLDEPRRAR